VPWPPKENKALYMPALPPRYRKLAEPFGIVGAIEVEASPLIEDNQWGARCCEKRPRYRRDRRSFGAFRARFCSKFRPFSQKSAVLRRPLRQFVGPQPRRRARKAAVRRRSEGARRCRNGARHGQSQSETDGHDGSRHRSRAELAR